MNKYDYLKNKSFFFCHCKSDERKFKYLEMLIFNLFLYCEMVKKNIEEITVVFSEIVK